MTNRKPNKGRKDPEQRAAKRRRQREAIARGAMPTAKRSGPSAQLDHASNPKAERKRRDFDGRIDPRDPLT